MRHGIFCRLLQNPRWGSVVFAGWLLVVTVSLLFIYIINNKEYNKE